MASKCSVSVMVRARPILLNKREQEQGNGDVCLSVKDNKTTIWDPTDRDKKRTFGFDRSFNSISLDVDNFASQMAVYEDVGIPSLEQALKGYNTTVFAYGQTGSGKTYTMMGQEDISITGKDAKVFDASTDLPSEVGVIPRFCTDLFSRLRESTRRSGGTVSHRVDSVYYEIYNDKVHDLLDHSTSRTYRVREHPKHGPYVEGLQHQEVDNYAAVAKLLKRGARDRHTAKTSMNDVSSRSHAVLELVLTTSKFDPNTGDLCDTSSRIALVDLAGSERQSAANTAGERLKEGACINKGLLSLGNVIEALAANSDKKSKSQRFVQYRDSTLTWLLKEALGGNSKTIMVATVSPSCLNYEESLSTLKYADRAKKIQNTVSINRDSKKAIIFALREEIKILKREIEDLRSGTIPLRDEEDELATTQPMVGHEVRVWKEEPYLLQIDPLPTLHDNILFWIEGEKTTYVGNADRTTAGTDVGIEHGAASPSNQMVTADHTIRLSQAKGVSDFHALFIREKGKVEIVPTNGAAYDGKAMAATPRSDEEPVELMVDGIRVSGRETLMSGSQVQIGEYLFIFVDPENVGDCYQFHARCQKLERAKVAEERQKHTMAKRVQDMLGTAGLELKALPSSEEALAMRGRDGDQVVVRGEQGPAVYVWKGDPETGMWMPADANQAELAALTYVDKKKGEVECSRRLTTILGASVQVRELPHESELSKSGPLEGEDAGPFLVRTQDTGLKVVQWDAELKQWCAVSDPVAELTARSIVDEAERKRREEHSAAFRKEIEEKMTDLDEVKRALTAATEDFASREQRLKKQLADRAMREEDLLKQTKEKDRLMQLHKQAQAQERDTLEQKIEQLTLEYEERLGNKEHVIQSLETSYSNAKYEWHKHETLLEAAIGTKQKTVEASNKLREDLTNANSDFSAVKSELDRAKHRIVEQEATISRIDTELHEAKDIIRESASEEVKEIQKLLEKKELSLSALSEEKEQLDGNLRRLSKHYLALQDELKEQQSRLVEYREQMEKEQETCREEGDRALQLQKECETARAEKNDLVNKIKQIQNDPKKKEQETKRRLENEALKERLEILEQERKQAEGSRNYAEQTARSEKQRVSDLQQRVKESTKQYQTMKEAYERESELVHQTKESLDKTREEAQAMKTELNQIKRQPGFMSPAESSRRDLDLSIQLEMVREENQRLQQKLADAEMLRQRSTESGRQMAKEKSDAEDALRKMKRDYKEAQSQLTAMTSRADRLKEMSQKLQSEALRKTRGGDKDEPESGRRTQPYGAGYVTPRKSGGPSTGRKRSVSTEVKVPSYAKPTSAWTTRDDDAPPPAAEATASTSFKNSNAKIRGVSPASKGHTPRKGRVVKSARGRGPSPAPPGVGVVSPPAINSPSPRASFTSKRSSSVEPKPPRATSKSNVVATEEF